MEKKKKIRTHAYVPRPSQVDIFPVPNRTHGFTRTLTARASCLHSHPVSPVVGVVAHRRHARASSAAASSAASPSLILVGGCFFAVRRRVSSVRTHASTHCRRANEPSSGRAHRIKKNNDSERRTDGRTGKNVQRNYTRNQMHHETATPRDDAPVVVTRASSFIHRHLRSQTFQLFSSPARRGVGFEPTTIWSVL